MSFEVDELVPVRHGGDPLDYGNVDAAHRSCNRRRAEVEMRAERGSAARPPAAPRALGLFPTSGDW